MAHTKDGNEYENKTDDFLNRVKSATKTPEKNTPVPKGFGSLKNAGVEERDYPPDTPKLEANKKNVKTKIRYERIQLVKADHPYISGKEIGEVCIVVCKIRKISESIADFYEDDKKEKMSIEIIEIAEPTGKV